jgi:predicted HAD superfamily Cof-like phosphohydrolase
MNKWQEQVRDFTRKVINGPTSPAEPAIRDAELRARLIAEEAAETIAALVGGPAAANILREFAYDAEATAEEPSIVEAIDGLCDVIYVALGTAEAIGVDLEPFFNEVHRTNMLKVGAPKDANGKVDGHALSRWRPPRIVDLLDAARRAVRGVGA